MNRFLSIDVLRGVIMIIMALDHVIGELGVHPASEWSIEGMLAFRGYTSPAQQWSRLMTHLCAPGFQLLAGMGLALSVARSQLAGKAEWRISVDLLIRGLVLIILDFTIMVPIFGINFFFMVLACIGACTLCFVLLRHLPRDLILLAGILIIVTSPLYRPTEMTSFTAENYALNVWHGVGGNFFLKKYACLYPILPWLGIFACGWWIGIKLSAAPKNENVNTSAKWFALSGLLLTVTGIVLRMSDWRYAEHYLLNDASIISARFWTFTKYPPSLVFIALTVGILLMLLGLFRYLLDSAPKDPFWARFVSVYGRTALFFFVGHFYLIKGIAWFLHSNNYLAKKDHLTFPQVYLCWLVVLLIMWPICFGYDKLRQRFRLVLRYF